MNPLDASVYADTSSPATWVLILTGIVLFVIALMVAFIALVHHSIEHSADHPKATAPEQLPRAGTGPSRPLHAA